MESRKNCDKCILTKFLPNTVCIIHTSNELTSSKVICLNCTSCPSEVLSAISWCSEIKIIFNMCHSKKFSNCVTYLLILEHSIWLTLIWRNIRDAYLVDLGASHYSVYTFQVLVAVAAAIVKARVVAVDDVAVSTYTTK